MKKLMLMTGMVGGMGMAYILFNKSTRKMIMQKMEGILNNADQMMKESIKKMV